MRKKDYVKIAELLAANHPDDAAEQVGYDAAVVQIGIACREMGHGRFNEVRFYDAVYNRYPHPRSR